ncbi:MAG TPA: hypothetical protein VL334_05610 [Anaerolineae bacterium]|nr:hypothetical protein [Anaerolineae bacterium]
MLSAKAGAFIPAGCFGRFHRQRRVKHPPIFWLTSVPRLRIRRADWDMHRGLEAAGDAAVDQRELARG